MTFISSKDDDEECVMHSKSNNIKFVSYDNANEVVNKLFGSPLFRYQTELKHQWEGLISFSTHFTHYLAVKIICIIT